MAKTRINLSATGKTRNTTDFMLLMGVILIVAGLPLMILIPSIGWISLAFGGFLLVTGVIAHFIYILTR